MSTPIHLPIGSLKLQSLTAGLLALSSGSIGYAAALPSGSVLIPAAAESDPIGGVLLASSTNPFAVAGSFSGTLTTSVYSGDVSNPLGGLTFAYQLVSDGVSGPNSIGRMSIQGWAGFLTDASYQVPSVSVAPAYIDRGISGDVIGFSFVPTPIDPLTGFLSPGSSSSLLVIQTDAAAWSKATASLIDGGVTTVSTFGPAVPEPEVWAIVSGVGLLAFGAWRRSFRKP